MPMWMYGYGWQMAFGMLFAILVLSGFAGLLIWMFTHRESNLPEYRDALAMSILNERYARGELDTVTFDKMRARLQPPNQLVEQDAVSL